MEAGVYFNHLIYSGMLMKDLVVVAPTRAIMMLSLSSNEVPIGEEVTCLGIWCEDCYIRTVDAWRLGFISSTAVC